MKIGRNEACPCGSGRKYKRCCATRKVRKAGASQNRTAKVTLGEAISQFQKVAAQKQEAVHQLGVFLFSSDSNGDAWLFEITDSDCIQIASAGEALDVPLEENDETIIVDWSHTFSFKNKQLLLTSYQGKSTMSLENAPVQQLFATRKRVLKKLSPEQLDQVHLDG